MRIFNRLQWIPKLLKLILEMNRNKYYKIQDLKIGVMLFGPYNEVE